MLQNHNCPECSEKNVIMSGFTDTDGINIITAEYFIGHYVAVAYESSDATLWPSPSMSLTVPNTASVTSSVASNSTAPATSSPTITQASPSSSVSETNTSRSGLSTSARAGIASAIAIAAVIAIATLLLLHRQRARKRKTSQETLDNVYTKAELPGESKPYGELDEATAFQEADGFSKPPEADNSNIRAELESDWTGWEASASLEIESPREAPDSLYEEAGRRTEQRNSIQQTPIDMVARR
jgi:hypothetical protein